jgi:hypothetical protein
MVQNNMAVDQACKNEMIKIIQSKLAMASLLLGAGAKTIAINKLQKFINTIPQNEYDLSLNDYITIHPKIRAKYPQAVSSLPECAYQYTMQELIECLDEIKSNI